jgi:hypothetical protein
MKENEGTFKLIAGPKVIGANEDKDIDDFAGIVKDQDGGDSQQSGEEDNEEGMDVKIEGFEEEDARDAAADQEEEEKDEDA